MFRKISASSLMLFGRLTRGRCLQETLGRVCLKTFSETRLLQRLPESRLPFALTRVSPSLDAGKAVIEAKRTKTTLASQPSLEAIATEKAAIATEKAAIATEKAAIETKLTDIATEKAAIATEKAAIETKQAAIEAEKTKLEAKNNEYESLLKKDEAQWTVVEKRLYRNPDKLYEMLERTDQLLATVEQSSAALNQRLATVERSSAALNQSSASLNQRLVTVEQSSATLNQRLAAIDQERLALTRTQPVEPIWRESPLDKKFTAAEFAFCDRSDAFAIFALSTEKRLVAWQSGSDDRNKHPIPFLADGPGTGKSRFLDEVPSSFVTFVQSRREQYPLLADLLVQDPLFVRINFGNGSPYDGIDAEFGIARALAHRILMQFLSNSLSYVNSVSRDIPLVEHALELISRNKTCIFLCIDEVNNVHDSNPKEFQELFNKVGGLSVSFKTFVVPILAGTVIGPIHKVVTQSTHPPLQIPLRLLSLESSTELVAKESKLPVVGHLRQLVADIGGHCRALEFLCKALAAISNPKSDKDWAIVFEQVRQRIGVRYDVELLPFSGALAYSFLSKDIGYRGFKCPGSDTLSFLDLEEKGLVKLNGPNTGPFLVQVPYIFVCIYLTALRDEPVAKFWNELLMGDNFWWQDWEVFCRNYVAFRLSLYSHLFQKSVSLKSFFKGALFNLPTDYDVIVPPFESIGIGKAKNQYPKSKEHVKTNVSMMNAANAPFDAFMFVQTTAEEQRLLLIFQMTFSSLDTKSQEKVGHEMLTLEYKKVKADMEEFLPETKFVLVFLTHREKRQDFKEDQIPQGCILVTKDEEKELFGELYYNRLSWV